MTIVPIEVRTMGLYLNITPDGVERLTEECTKAAKTMHSLAGVSKVQLLGDRLGLPTTYPTN